MNQRLPKSLIVPLCAISLFTLVMASTAPARAQHGYTVLHRFHGGDGANPLAPLAVDRQGNIYGTTSMGGDLNCSAPNGCGVVFQLKANGGDPDLLHIFTGPPDGEFPAAGVVPGPNGTFYGTTQSGGSGCPPSACGTVYKVQQTGRETVLYNFKGGPSDGASPLGSLFLDENQNLFGTTASGGQQGVFGAAFELTPSGDETVLHFFTNFFASSPDGSIPAAGFVSDAAGNLYSTTQTGGSSNPNCNGVGCGTVFELTPNGSGGWNESIAYSFLGGSDGYKPIGNLAEDASGNLYGVTAGGGSNTNCGSFGCGIVFKLTRMSSGWTESVLYNFTDGLDGAGPDSLVSDSQGNLYVATTNGGGQNIHGTLVSLSPSGQLTVLHSFTGGPDGASPQVGLMIEKPNTIILGATAGGGDPTCSGFPNGCGVVFSYAP